MVDDLIDEAGSPTEAAAHLDQIVHFLDALYPSASQPDTITDKRSPKPQVDAAISTLPASARPSFRLLASLRVPRPPLDELIHGFRTDLLFSTAPAPSSVISTDGELMAYASDVAASVAELCVVLAWNRSTGPWPPPAERARIIRSARAMGQALQLVNIARDVPADARLGRCYIPQGDIEHLKTREGLREVPKARVALVQRATELAAREWEAIERLPRECRAGMRVACKVYLGIGEAVERALREGRVEDRASVSRWSRLRTAWGALA